MAELLVATLTIAVALTGVLSLIDSAIAGRHALARLMSERAQARAGFGPPLALGDVGERRMRALAGAAHLHRSGCAPVRARTRVQPSLVLFAA